jgi:hypothetical protein
MSKSVDKEEEKRRRRRGVYIPASVSTPRYSRHI